MELVFAFDTQIPSGKNQQLFGHGHKYPNHRFVAWKALAAADLLIQKAKLPTRTKMQLPLRGPLRMTVQYHPLDNYHRDLTGMCDALQHILEYMEIIENDDQIKCLHWLWPYDNTGPCAVVMLEEL